MKQYAWNFFLTLVCCSLATYFLFTQLNHPLIGIDDANIYFVYARNLANGHGLVYNAGGERVEGFTSLLWTLASALVFKISSHPEPILLVINMILLSLGSAAALTYLQSNFLLEEQDRQKKLLYSIAFVALLFTSPRYIFWNTVTLMENSLWSTLLLVTAIFVIKDPLSSRVINLVFLSLSIFLILTRPEASLWILVFAAVCFLRLAFATNGKNAFKMLIPATFGILVTWGALTGFRLWYFGYPLPNTYYAKVSPSLAYNLQQGLIYLSKYFVSDPLVLLSICAIFVAGTHTLIRIFSKQVPQDGSFFLPIIAWTGLLAPIVTGGDHFGSFRFYQNIYPIEGLCLIYCIDRIIPGLLQSVPKSNTVSRRRPVVWLGAVLVVILFGISQFQVWKSIESEINIEFRVADYGRKNGMFIQQLFADLHKLPSLGVVTSGGIKYSYEGTVIDLMGLNNTMMAHSQGDRRGTKNHAAFNIQTFYVLQPEIVWPLTLDTTQWQYSEMEIKESWENTDGFKGLFDESRFLELYTYAQVSRQTEKKYALIAWFRKDFLQQLSMHPDFRVKTYEYAP